MLDDQDGNIGGDVLDEVRDALALGGGKARQRLVEQQHLRLGAERDAEIDQPLPAIGELAALDGLDAFEAEEFDQLRGLGVDVLVVVDVAPEVEAPGVLRLQRQAQVFVDRQPLNRLVIWNERASPWWQIGSDGTPWMSRPFEVDGAAVGA